MFDDVCQWCTMYIKDFYLHVVLRIQNQKCASIQRRRVLYNIIQSNIVEYRLRVWWRVQDEDATQLCSVKSANSKKIFFNKLKMVQNIIQNSKCDELVSACRSAEKPCHVSSALPWCSSSPSPIFHIQYCLLLVAVTYHGPWARMRDEGPPNSLHSTFTSLHAAADAVLQLPVWWWPVNAPLNQLKLISILWCSEAILLSGWLILLLIQSNPKYWQENVENSR